MAKFIEVLKDGLTVSGSVKRAGVRTQVPDEFTILSKKAQVKQWGKPRYRQITKADFEDVGGEVVPDEAPAGGEETEGAGEPFAAFEGLNAEETLALAAGLPEDQLAAFITFEAEGQNRKSVLEPLGVEFDVE